MKIAKVLFNQCSLILLLCVIFARGLDENVADADASQNPHAKVPFMSTGETPAAFVQKKIDSHDVSARNKWWRRAVQTVDRNLRGCLGCTRSLCNGFLTSWHRRSLLFFLPTRSWSLLDHTVHTTDRRKTY
jgi:hypothetical protein